LNPVQAWIFSGFNFTKTEMINHAFMLKEYRKWNNFFHLRAGQFSFFRLMLWR